MTNITLKGSPINTDINPPAVGTVAPDFTLVKQDLSEASLSDYRGKKVILNIFPSVDTGTCAMSVKKFNEKLASLKHVEVLCISQDLPFAQERFCGAENTERVTTLSAFRSEFGKNYGVLLNDSPLKGLLARVVIALDETGKVLYQEVVSEITEEPAYDKVLAVCS